MPKTVYPIELPYQPQLLSVVCHAISDILDPWGALVFEFGSGHSTLWLADICGAQVVAVEHDQGWLEEVRRAIKYQRASADVILSLEDEIPIVIKIYPDNKFDLVLVDCLDRMRLECARVSLDKIKVGGWLVVDDTNWLDLATGLDGIVPKDWEKFCVFGNFTRLDGTIRRHQTTFYRKPKEDSAKNS